MTQIQKIILGIFSIVLLAVGVWIGANFCDKENKTPDSELVTISPLSTAEDTIKIGAVIPLTGKAARYGKWIQEGLLLAEEEVNQGGGINGRPIEVIFADDQAKPDQATLALQNLISTHDISVVYGSWASSSVLAMAPIAEKNKIVVIASAISPKIRDAGEYIFRMQPDARYYIRELVPYAYQTLSARTANIVHINNDFGLDQAKVFKEEFEALGGKVLRVESYLGDAISFRAQLTNIKQQSADVLFIAGYSETGLVIKQARELGIDTQILGSVPTENPDLFSIAGSAAEGVIFPSHFNPYSSDPKVKQFQNKYKEKWGEQAEGFAALAYDALNIISLIIKDTGTNSTLIKDALTNMPPYQGVTNTTDFDEYGDVIKPIVIKIARDSAFHTVD